MKCSIQAVYTDFNKPVFRMAQYWHTNFLGIILKLDT